MRPGRRLERKANVTITLPLQLLDKIDDLVDEGKARSRSQLVREAVEKYIRTL
jgi:metal-responsive CopG/Arc/MetJ family transcriptional regulator